MVRGTSGEEAQREQLQVKDLPSVHMTCCVWSPINVYPGAGAPKGRPCLAPRPYSDPCHPKARNSGPPAQLSWGGTSLRDGQQLARSIIELDTAGSHQ